MGSRLGKGPKNRSEEVVARICRRNFLALWSYPNPLRDDKKELCDALVVCHPTVIIFSVKEIPYTEHDDPAVALERWHRRAIGASVRQIYGAERWLQKASHVIRHDGRQGLMLPPLAERVVHRVAIALGGKGEVPIVSKDFGKGFVHTYDEVSLDQVLGELDTITEFVEFLRATEQLLKTTTVLSGTTADLLAMYISNQRSFPSNHDVILLDGDLWNGFSQRPEVKARKEADRVSYAWDHVLDVFAEDVLEGRMILNSDMAETEGALRLMAKESRFNRRILGMAFDGFMQNAAEGKMAARYCKSPSGVAYVFVARPHEFPRETRMQELALRCHVVRGLLQDVTQVVGIATERPVPGKGFSLDLQLLEIPEWTKEHQVQLELIQRDLHYFVNPAITKGSEDEFPLIPATSDNAEG